MGKGPSLELSNIDQMQSQVETQYVSEQHVPLTSKLLRVIDVRKSFTAPNGNRLDVLRGVSFEVAPGECIAIMGASGSGKSTLLHLLGGLDLPDHGSISLGSYNIEKMHARELATLRQHEIGFVFQFHYLLTDLNAVENVAMPLLINRKGKVVAFETGRQLLKKLGLEERAYYPVAHLSGGELQRVAVARAIVREPGLLLADEPTGNLDAAAGEEIGKTLTEYTHDREAIAVIATHNEFLARSCDRLLTLKNGRIYSG